MKKLTFCLLIIFTIISIQAETVINSGNVKGKWTLTGSPYKINGNITILDNEKLEIEAGVQVLFQGYYKISIYGVLLAIGTSTSHIKFERPIADTIGLSNISATTGGWNGIEWDTEGAGWTMYDNDSSVVDYCDFKFAKATGAGRFANGGALRLDDFDKVRISNCIFYRNAAISNGGALSYSSSSCVIYNCSFIENKAKENGGAIYSEGASNSKIYNCIIKTNNALKAGGAIFFMNSSADVQQCLIANNFAVENGAALYFILSNDFLANNLIINNGSLNNGAIALNTSSPLFINNTIANNKCGWVGGIVIWGTSGASFYNNIIWGNVKNDNNPKQIEMSSASTEPLFANCIIPKEDVYTSNDFTHNAKFVNSIETDPQFVNPSISVGNSVDITATNWRLKNTSPAINKGVINSFTKRAKNIDYYKTQRIKNGLPDIGAAEAYIGKIIAATSIDTVVQWNADTVIVNNNITIKDSAKLILVPGTKVLFTDNYYIRVDGVLVAKGQKELPIMFTRTDTVGFSNKNIANGGWGGIVFDNDNTGANGKMSDNDSSLFENCIFEFGKRIQVLTWNISAGAMNIKYFSKVKVSKCTFRYNYGLSGGALAISNLSEPIISGNIFYKNVSEDQGGAIYCDIKCKPLIINNLITNNTSRNWSGGGIGIFHCDPTFVNNIVCHNNSGGDGGGVYLNDANPIFTNNTVVYNYAIRGGGIGNWYCSPSIYNSVFWGNKSKQKEGNEVLAHPSMNFYNCNIKDYSVWPNVAWNWFDTLKIYSLKPVFVKSADTTVFDGLKADYNITSFSGNINKGTLNIPGYTIPSTDFLGNSRVNDGKIDLGAIEEQSEIFEITEQPKGEVLCEGDTSVINVSTSDTALYQWYKDGEMIIGATKNKLVINQLTETNSGNYSCQVWNAYSRVFTNPVQLLVRKAPSIELQPVNGYAAFGKEFSIKIQADGFKPISYQWYKDGSKIKDDTLAVLTLDSFILANEAKYKCNISNVCGTKSTNEVTAYVAPQICMVTVDTLTGRNLIVWEKNSKANYKKYKIYREGTIEDYYDYIGVVTSTESGVYIDKNVNPREQAFYYKITGVDANNRETSLDLCSPHKTIHLLVTKGTQGGYQLDWDKYIGFLYGTYHIYRSTSRSNFKEVKDIASSSNTWTDLNAPNTDTVFYYVTVSKANACYPSGKTTKAGGGVYVQAISNMEDNRLRATDLNNLETGGIDIYPNPASEVINIILPQSLNSTDEILITDVTGKLHYTSKMVNSEEKNGFAINLKRAGINPGVYCVTIKLKNQHYTKKIVIAN